jgi:LmbE family N-acetylglucosaminyl deacetylase
VTTIVWLHAHPDDEALLTGGSMRRAAEEGHRNVLVVATNGDHGEVPDDLAPGETLVDRRRAETEASAAVLGVDRVVWLGYADSGMNGWPQNDHTDAFMRTPVDHAATRLADLLRDERAGVLVTYDWHGNYGHPDHVAVHRVGHRAAELAATPVVFEATLDRDALRAMAAAFRAARPDDEPFEVDGPTDDGNPLGMPAEAITHVADVRAHVAVKRQAVACHRSQVTDTSFFMQLPDELFVLGFGIEWFIRVGDEPDGRRRELHAELHRA